MEERLYLSWGGFFTNPSILIPFIFLKACPKKIRGAAGHF
jgi:hypothetical protein